MTTPEQTPMRRFPNPWVTIPALIAGAAGWFVGSRVAGLSCGAGSCVGQEVLWGTIGALVGFVGVLVVAVLAVRSLAEWAALSEAERAAPGRRDEPPTC
jgi:hypothetical protein